jgi:hypothetical protein
MPDVPDPPRKIYGLKSSQDFERVNGRTDAPSDSPTDVQGFIKSANRTDLATKANAPVNRSNEVHAMLQHNLQCDAAAGLHQVSTAPDPRRRRRILTFWIAITVVDVPLGVIAWEIGHEMAIPFVCAIGAIAMFTGVLIWRTWCFRTEA